MLQNIYNLIGREEHNIGRIVLSFSIFYHLIKNLFIYIYIYIERERERAPPTCMCYKLCSLITLKYKNEDIMQ